MTLNLNDFNIGEIIDSQANPANTVGNGEASQMLDILKELRSDMQSMTGRIANLEEQSRPTTSRGDGPSERWADHMDGLNATMYTEPHYDEEDDDGDKENESTQGTKLFAVTKETESFLKEHFSKRADNPTRRQWREKHGAPRLNATACPKVDKILKQNLSSQTKARDRQLSKSQALVLDAVGPLAFVLESAARGSLTQESAIEAAQTALKLLGNASCHLATERRRNALADLNPNLKEMAEEDSLYAEATPNLFGDGFSKKAKERDDELKVLRSAKVPQKKSTFNTQWKGRDNQFFQGRRPFTQANRGGGTFRGHGRTNFGNRPRPYPQRGSRPQNNSQTNQN